MSTQFMRILNKTIKSTTPINSHTATATATDDNTTIQQINNKHKSFFDNDNDNDNDKNDVEDEPSSPSMTCSQPSDTSIDTKTNKRELRQQLNIHITTDNLKAVPAPIASIQQIHNLIAPTNKQLLDTIIHNFTSEYNTLTPIQSQSIPLFTQKKFDVLSCAPTGSGKTLSYLIPLLLCLNSPSTTRHELRSVILCPTKELADQIYRVLLSILHTHNDQNNDCIKFNAHVLTRSIKNILPEFMDIIISTPARFIQFIDQNQLDCSTVEYLLLDEADKLFDMNFLEDIDRVLVLCSNTNIRRHLYSATMVSGVESLARSILRNPVRITIGARNSAATQIKQELIFCGREEGKLLALRQYMSSGLPIPMLIFVQSIDRAKQLYHELQYDTNIKCNVIHGDKTAEQRTQIIRDFRMGIIYVLICTDILGRGIDFLNINCVINYDFPTSTTQYIHRIGRTGRSNRTGCALTLFTEQDRPLLRNIAEIIHHSGSSVPQWMLRELPRIGKQRGDRLQQFGVPRQSISDEIHQQQTQNIRKLKQKTKASKRTIDVIISQSNSFTSNKYETAPGKHMKLHHQPSIHTSTHTQAGSTHKPSTGIGAGTGTIDPTIPSSSAAKKSMKKSSNATFLQDQVAERQKQLHGTTLSNTVTKTIRKQSPSSIARNERRWQAKLAQLKADGLIQTNNQ